MGETNVQLSPDQMDWQLQLFTFKP